jgi:hypothetical protein
MRAGAFLHRHEAAIGARFTHVVCSRVDLLFVQVCTCPASPLHLLSCISTAISHLDLSVVQGVQLRDILTLRTPDFGLDMGYNDRWIGGPRDQVFTVMRRVERMTSFLTARTDLCSDDPSCVLPHPERGYPWCFNASRRAYHAEAYAETMADLVSRRGVPMAAGAALIGTCCGPSPLPASVSPRRRSGTPRSRAEIAPRSRRDRAETWSLTAWLDLRRARLPTRYHRRLRTNGDLDELKWTARPGCALDRLGTRKDRSAAHGVRLREEHAMRACELAAHAAACYNSTGETAAL